MIKLTTSMVMPSNMEYYLNSRSILDQSFDKSFASKAKATFTIEVKQVAGNSESIQFVIKFELLLSTGRAENPRYINMPNTAPVLALPITLYTTTITPKSAYPYRKNMSQRSDKLVVEKMPRPVTAIAMRLITALIDV